MTISPAPVTGTPAATTPTATPTATPGITTTNRAQWLTLAGAAWLLRIGAGTVALALMEAA